MRWNQREASACCYCIAMLDRFSFASVASSQRMKTIHIDPHTDPRWERFVAEHPDGTIYHHPAWIKALEMEYGQRVAHLACEDEAGTLRAILPLMYTEGVPLISRNRLYGKRLSSLPRTPLAGPLASDTAAARAVLEAAASEARNGGQHLLQIKAQCMKFDGLVEGLVCTPWRLSYVLPLSGARDEFYIADGSHRSSIQRALKKSARSGVVVRNADCEDDVRSWYRLYLHNMRRNAIPPRSLRFFLKIWELLRPRSLLQLVVADHPSSRGREIVAGSVYLMYRGTVSNMFNGASEEHLSLRPNEAIHWHAINEAVRTGCTAFDFGEVPEGHETLARFKMKWGSQPVRLYRYYYPGNLFPARETERTGHYAPLMAEALWRHLPLGVTAALGDRIYSYL